MLLSLVSGKSTFLHDAGYIATIENCCVPIVVKRMLFATRVASLLLGALHIFYVRNIIVIKCLVQHKVVAIELYT